MRKGESKSKRTFAGPVKNHCRECGRTNKNADEGNWFWANQECSICSDCAKIKIAPMAELIAERRSLNLHRCPKVLKRYRERMAARQRSSVIHGVSLDDSILVPGLTSTTSTRRKKARAS